VYFYGDNALFKPLPASTLKKFDLSKSALVTLSRQDVYLTEEQLVIDSKNYQYLLSTVDVSLQARLDHKFPIGPGRTIRAKNRNDQIFSGSLVLRQLHRLMLPNLKGVPTRLI
jgi:hypothetical protein